MADISGRVNLGIYDESVEYSRDCAFPGLSGGLKA